MPLLPPPPLLLLGLPPPPFPGVPAGHVHAYERPTPDNLTPLTPWCVPAGHVHAYERSHRVFDNQLDECGPIYM